MLCYILVGYWSTPEEDQYRVNHLKEEYHIDSYVMPYNTQDNYQRLYRNYVNNKKVFYTITWNKYLQDLKEDYLRKSNEVEEVINFSLKKEDKKEKQLKLI